MSCKCIRGLSDDAPDNPLAAFMHTFWRCLKRTHTSRLVGPRHSQRHVETTYATVRCTKCGVVWRSRGLYLCTVLDQETTHVEAS